MSDNKESDNSAEKAMKAFSSHITGKGQGIEEKRRCRQLGLWTMALMFGLMVYAVGIVELVEGDSKFVFLIGAALITTGFVRLIGMVLDSQKSLETKLEQIEEKIH